MNLKTTGIVGAGLLTLLSLGRLVSAGAGGDAERLDCPGKIVCPLTGELVCEDRCPLGTEEPVVAELPPPCCRK